METLSYYNGLLKKIKQMCVYRFKKNSLELKIGIVLITKDNISS